MLTLKATEEAPRNWAEAIAASPNPFRTACERYSRAPIGFVREVLHAEPDEWQLEALRALAHGHTRIAVRSGHGVGKTALAAWTMVWFSNTRAPFKIAVTAPTAPQLFDALWPELLKWITLLPDAWRNLWEITSDHVTLKGDQECFITARTSRPDKPEAMAGLHSANILLVGDEASGIDEAVYEAAGGSMSSPGAVTLLIGNPTRSSGFFWRCHLMERDRWFTMRVSSIDSQRVAPGWVREQAQRYGIDSNAYRIRVLGEFPVADSDTVIPAGLVDDAMTRDVPINPALPEIWGLDVARFGDDASVLIKRRGNVVPEMPRRWRNIDTMALAGAIKAEYDGQLTHKPALIVIDVIGIGAGVVDRLHEQNMPVLGVNVAETPSTSGRFGRLRDELWIRCREWLETRAVRLPRDDQLRSDLVGPRYSFLSDGRMQIEPKAKMRARGLPSPDCFVAGTMVATPQGERPIETIRIGDWVITPFGSTRVIAAWATPAASLTTVAFSHGRALIGTGHHKVFCWDAGIKSLDALSLTDRMEPLKRGRLVAWRALSLLSTAERDSEFRPLVDTINRAGKTSPSAFCIVVCGQTITELSQRVRRFTIRMVIGAITPLQTLNWSISANINANTRSTDWPSQERWNKTRNIWQRLAWPQPSGTDRPTASPGIANTPLRHGRRGNGTISYASAAAASSNRHSAIHSFVRPPVAKEMYGIHGAGSRIVAFVIGVAKSSWQTVIGRRRVVPVSVATENVLPTSVFNLTLAKHNAYYANGILVFNSADALNMTFAEQGLGIASGMTSGLHDNQPMVMEMGRAMEV